MSTATTQQKGQKMVAYLPSNLQEIDTPSEARHRARCDIVAVYDRLWTKADLADLLHPLFEVSPSLAAFLERCVTWLSSWMKGT